MMAESVSLLNESSDSEVEFSINKSYADRYDLWRNKEEMQKLKDLSKDISETSSSDSEEEDEPVIEKDFLKTLSLLKSKDPKIYNENIEFFKEESTQKKPKVKKEKPMFMKDYERKLVLERNGKFSDDDEDDDTPAKTPTNREELDEITKSFKIAESDDENQESELGGLFQVRKKTKAEEDQEEEEHLQWLKGQKKNIDKQTEKDMSFLRKFWNDPDLDDGEKFLRDYLLNYKYMEKEKSDEIPSYAEITEDAETLLEDEKDIEQQELFEHKYNFRFEEPDQEFVKRYPRTIGDSLRRVDNKRKMKREDYAERKKKEKEQKREELKRLKALKRKEIEEKFFKLKETIGKEELNFDEGDIESDFDPDKHDEKMKELFNDDYYEEEEQQKPEFLYDEEIDDENWDHWSREQATTSGAQKQLSNKDEEESDDDHDESKDQKTQFEQEMVESTHTGRRKGRKKSLFAKVVAQPKPLYDPSGKSFDEYLDEYYRLDYEDLIGDLPVRFKYRKVIPNDFGLNVNEILTANDKELNRWCSVKKTCQYRRDEEELYDVQAFKKKSQNVTAKQKILSSIYAPDKEEEDVEPNTNPSSSNENNAKRKKKSSKKKATLKTNLPNDEEDNSMQDYNIPNTDADMETLKKSGLNPDNISKRKKKRKRQIESTEEVAHQLVENVNLNSQGISTENIDDVSSYKDEHTESSKATDANTIKRKKKKHKKKTEFATEVSDDGTSAVSSSNISDIYSNKDSFVKGKDEKNQSCYSPVAVTNDNIEIDVLKKKSKRKKKNKKSKSSFEDLKIKQYISASKKQHKKTESDKRLEIPNERLAAFGINPKKFKNSIIYSKK